MGCELKKGSVYVREVDEIVLITSGDWCLKVLLFLGMDSFIFSISLAYNSCIA